MKRTVIIGSTIALFIMTFFSGIFIDKSAVNGPIGFLRQYFKVDFYQENVLLKLENENLKAQLQRAADQGALVSADPARNRQDIGVRVFSTYPFNVKDTVTIDRGSEAGISVGMPALVSDAILFGQVMSVDRTSAIVRTVFDSHWQLPVKIGPDGVNGLFQGGNDPKVVLVERPVKTGDGVFAASKDFPLGIKIGEIKEVREDQGGVFKEAIVKTPYDAGEVTALHLTMR